MSKKKIQKQQSQVKLVFNGGTSEGYDVGTIMSELGLELEALAVSSGMAIIQALMGSEVEALAGKPYSRHRPVNRYGTEDGYIVLGGQKVPTKHQRLRNRDNEEVRLESYQQFQRDTDRTRAVFSRLVHGLSCRKYPETIETVQQGYGISKSVINRDAIGATAEQLRSLCERNLTDLDIRVLVIDGVHIANTVQLVAMGIEANGIKHILGFREGAMENHRVCVELLEDLARRGFRNDQPMLVIIDGSKALRSAVEHFFGASAEIQRCEIHKRRNVKDHLPKKYHADIDRRIQAAYKMTSYPEAKRALENIVRYLEPLNASAARSLEEGMEETLTVHRLGIPDILRKSFASTNLIESAFSQSRPVMRHVKRWRNSAQIQRWTATALLESEKRFRKVRGYKSMGILISALEGAFKQKGLAKTELVA
jgi:transposase-like protein